MLEQKQVTVKPLIVVVHGVGQQLELDTMRSFIEGSTADHPIPATKTRAQLADELRVNGIISIDGLPVTFQEFNYAKTITKYATYLEQDTQRWIRSLRNTLRDINKRRNGPPGETFIELQHVTYDISFAMTLLRHLAGYFHLRTGPIMNAATGFVQQVQLYIDCEPYREAINDDFQQKMEKIAETGEVPTITLVSHSLGTVVVFRALLEGARKGALWVKAIRKWNTFGSPIDLFLLLYPELFSKAGLAGKSNLIGQPETAISKIRWTNYSFGNDPIATDLAIARHFLHTEYPGLFEEDAPEEVDLGSGSLSHAHTDYWYSAEMLRDIYVQGDPQPPVAVDSVTSSQQTGSGPIEKKPSESDLPAPRSRMNGSAFNIASRATAAIAGWLIIIWWEENLKGDDAQRVIFFDNALYQVFFWAVICAMIISHVRCWSSREVKYLFASTVFALLLIVFMPGLRLLDGVISVNTGYNSLRLGPPLQHWDFGNLCLLLVIITAITGIFSRPRQQRGQVEWRVVKALIVTAAVLSICVGKRNNPSNFAAEIALLSLIFAFWWLSILLARIDLAYRLYIGGRVHLDTLASHWQVGSKRRPFRSLASIASET